MKLRSFVAEHPNLVALFVLLVAAFGLYGSSLIGGGFQVDDWWWLLGAKRGGPLGIYEGWKGQGLFLRPVISVSFYGLWKLFGLQPAGYRAFNILLQVLTAYSLRAIWLRLAPARDRTLALGVALLFLAWPTHPETVVWIAGMTDGLAIALGTLAIWSYLASLQDRRPALLAVSLVIFAVAVLAKESALPLLIVAILLGFLACLEARARLALPSALLLLLGAAYWPLRRALLGHVIGGYANGLGAQSYLFGATGNRMITNLSNAYLPFAKYVHLIGGFGWVRLELEVAIVGVAALALRAIPRSATRHDLPIALFAVCTLGVGLIWMGFLYTGWGYFVLFALIKAPASLPLALLLVAYLVWRGKTPLMRAAGRIAKGGSWPFLTAVTLVAVALAQKTVLFVDSALIAAIVLLLVFVTRPLHEESDSQGPSWRALLLTCFVASVLCLLPAVNLLIGIDGQQARFSYAGTLFSVPAICAALCLLVKPVAARREVFGGVILAAGMLFILWLDPWVVSSRLWRQASDRIAEVSPARRIYVVGAPGMIGHAVGFLGGLEVVPEVVNDDKKTEVTMVAQLLSLLPSDTISVAGGADGRFRVRVYKSPAKHFTAPQFEVGSDPGVQAHAAKPSETLAGDAIDQWVEIPNLQPGDRVLAITDRAVLLLR